MKIDDAWGENRYQVESTMASNKLVRVRDEHSHLYNKTSCIKIEEYLELTTDLQYKVEENLET